LSVVSGRETDFAGSPGRVVWRLRFQAASILAASTSMIGMSSWMGYTRRHSAHFRLAPFALKTTGFLQTGQTSMSSRSCEIIETLLYSGQNGPKCVERQFSDQRGSTALVIPGDSLFARWLRTP